MGKRLLLCFLFHFSKERSLLFMNVKWRLYLLGRVGANGRLFLPPPQKKKIDFCLGYLYHYDKAVLCCVNDSDLSFTSSLITLMHFTPCVRFTCVWHGKKWLWILNHSTHWSNQNFHCGKQQKYQEYFVINSLCHLSLTVQHLRIRRVCFRSRCQDNYGVFCYFKSMWNTELSLLF